MKPSDRPVLTTLKVYVEGSDPLANLANIPEMRDPLSFAIKAGPILVQPLLDISVASAVCW